jgi:hypothetical protein
MVNILRRVFFLRHIHERRTFVGSMMILLYVTLASVVLMGFLAQYVYLLWAVLAMIGYVVLRVAVEDYVIGDRLKASSIPMQFMQGASIDSRFRSASTINQELNSADSLDVLSHGDNWQVYDATFDFYRHTKSGDYLDKQIFYTVYEQRLLRPLPNIILITKWHGVGSLGFAF